MLDDSVEESVPEVEDSDEDRMQDGLADSDEGDSDL